MCGSGRKCGQLGKCDTPRPEGYKIKSKGKFKSQKTKVKTLLPEIQEEQENSKLMSDTMALSRRSSVA